MNTPDRLTCEEVFRKLDDYVDRELTALEIEQVDAHLAICSVCAGEYLFEQSLLDGLREKLTKIRLPREALERILAAIR